MYLRRNAIIGFALIVASCGDGSVSVTSTSSASSTQNPTTTNTAASSVPTTTLVPDCPNPEGGVCLGTLDAGTYDTTLFRPPITYTVPAGWSNFEDLPGSLLLVPPDNDLAGVNAGTSDFIGISTSVAAADATCQAQAAPGVGLTVDDVTAELASRPGLTVTPPATVTIGGLDGMVFDITMAEDWTDDCPFLPGVPVVPLIIGFATSEGMHHVMIEDLVIRLYLLNLGGLSLAIEVNDVPDGDQLDGYASVVDQLEFHE